MSAQSTCISTVSRRGFLQAGFLAMGGLGLGDLLCLRAAAADKSSQDTSIILIWLQGGPSHMETYDLKPEAPLDYRGLMQPIRTNVDGMDVCELLPRTARIAGTQSTEMCFSGSGSTLYTTCGQSRDSRAPGC